VEDLTVSLEGRRVLEGIDLALARGTTTSVLGPSGGGKTTLLRAVAGLVAPDRGRVRLDGVDVTALPPERRGVGLMFQDHALWPHRDVAGNVGFGLRMAGVAAPERRRRVAEVLALVGLAGYERRRVTELSGGEAQRVALARSLAPEPRVLCLDEPLGSLDRVLHEHLVTELGELFERLGLTVLHVTHDQHEALALADELVVLGEGRVLQRGRPEAVWRQPATEAVARFLGHDTIVPVVVGDGGCVRAGGVELLRRPGAVVGPASLVIRSDAVRPAPPHGDGIEARVLSAAFAGDATVVEAAVDRWGPGEVVVRYRATGAAPTRGSVVTLALDEDGCVLVPSPDQSPATSPTGQDTPVPPRPQ
jgi:thiamine transport system ATP-binding protein